MKSFFTRPRILACSIIAVAVVLILIGVALNQPTHVWQKASLICFECIGLG